MQTTYPSYMLARLAEALSEYFYNRGEIVALLDEAEIPAQRVNLEQDAASVWSDAVRDANSLGKVRTLTERALARFESGPARARFQAILAGIVDHDNRLLLAAPPRFGEKKTPERNGWNG